MKTPIKFGKAFCSLLCALLLLGTVERSNAQTSLCIETNAVKFLLPPQVDQGLDVKDSRNSIVLADDFICTKTGPIPDIHVWGSWLNDQHGTITNFWVGIYSDVPAVTGGTGGLIISNSHPGTLLWWTNFPQGQFAENFYTNGSEYFYNPTNGSLGNDTAVYYYCFYPTNPFVQQGSTTNPVIYWLAIRAQLASDGTLHGWKSSSVSFNDPAVWGTVNALGFPSGNWQSMTNPITQQPLHLSMKLSMPTNPPPTTCCPELGSVKWLQNPNLTNGVDISISGQPGAYSMFDDFKCTNSGAITDIHLWGSWVADVVGTNEGFRLSIWSDVPAGTDASFSHPGVELWTQQFFHGQYTVCFYAQAPESTYGIPNPHFSNTNLVYYGATTNLYYLCFYPTNPFVQTGSPNAPTNYWLMVANGGSFNWKSSSDAYGDAAFYPGVGPGGLGVPLYDPTDPSGQRPLNMAFKITTATNPPTQTVCYETNGVKYVQWPDLYSGQGADVWNSSSRPIQVADGPWWLADDFVCTNTGPITDIHLWGSWQNDAPLTGRIVFQLYVLDDVQPGPTNPLPYSHPGTNVIWHQTFAPGSYAETIWANNATEYFLDPGPPQILGGDSVVWYYCFYPTNLTQYGTVALPKTYWLAAFAELPTGTTNVFGWKTTTNVQHDVSTHLFWSGSGTSPTNSLAWIRNYEFPGNSQPLDLAFKLTTPTNNSPPILCGDTNTVKFYDPPASGITFPNDGDEKDSGDQVVLADDFPCTNTGPITGIHVWGSFVNNVHGSISNFWIGIYNDVPAVTSPFTGQIISNSHPGTLLWSNNFAASAGQFTETFYRNEVPYFNSNSPACDIFIGSGGTLYQYCFFPTNPFIQMGTAAAPTNYWLAIRAQLYDTNTQIIYGWKTADNPYGDPAVSGTVGSGGLPIGNWQSMSNTFCFPQHLSMLLTTSTNCTPTIQCSGNKTVNCGAAWSFDPPVVNDPCCPASQVTVTTNIMTNSITACSQSYTATFTVSDCNGIIATCPQTVTVLDTNAPTLINCGANRIVECGTAWSFATPTAQYLCSGSNVFVGIFSSNVFSINPCRTTNTIVWSATNQCSGAFSTCSQTVIVEDTNPPVFTSFPTNLVTSTCNTNIQVFWPLATATDACSSVTITYSPTNGSSFHSLSTNTVTITASDACGNATNKTFTVAVQRPALTPFTIKYLGTNRWYVLTWPAGILQVAGMTNLMKSTTNVQGPYVDVPGATSPYTNTTSMPAQFFRLRCN